MKDNILSAITTFLLVIIVSVLVFALYFMFNRVDGANIKIVEVNCSSIVCYDIETKVMYLQGSGGITPMYNADGTLKLYDEEE